MFCHCCKKEYTFDQLTDQTVDGVGEIYCPSCGSVLMYKIIDYEPETPVRKTWEINRTDNSHNSHKSIIVHTHLRNFLGE